MPIAERTLTDFLQHSGRILPEVERGELKLRRRNGDSLVVLSERYWQALLTSFVTLAQAMRDIQDRCHCPPKEGVGEFALSWLSFLNEPERQECIRELSLAVVAAFEDGRFEDLTDTLAQWRATALATWDDAQKFQDYWESAPVEVGRP